MNLSIAEVRRRLSVGTQFRATFLGGPLRIRGNDGDVVFSNPPPTQRKVTKQSAHEMASEFLDGPKKGQTIYCQWKGVTAREENGEIILTQEGHDFVSILTNLSADRNPAYDGPMGIFTGMDE